MKKNLYIICGVVLFFILTGALVFFINNKQVAQALNLRASLNSSMPVAEKIGAATHKTGRLLQDDEFVVMKNGPETGAKITVMVSVADGIDYPVQISEGQSVTVLAPEGNTGYEVDDTTEIHNLSEIYRDDASMKAKVSPVVPAVLGKKDTVPVIIRFADLEKPYAASDNSQKRNEKQANFKAKKEKIKKAIGNNGKIKTDLFIINGIAADINKNALDNLGKNADVEKVEYDSTYYTVLDTSLNDIFAKDAWNSFDGNNTLITGANMRIAIVDTGVDYNHADLGGCLGTGCKVAQGWDFVNKDADPMDDMGHGTHVAATAAGKGLLNGVAPDATIYAYKVCNSSGSCAGSNMIAAMQRATDPNQDGDSSDHVDVGNMSLGGGGNPADANSVAVDNSSAAGVVWAISAGNSGPNLATIGSPGTAKSAVTVAAAYKASANSSIPIASFSSRGPVIYNGVDYLKPDVSAPGVSICAARWDSAWSSVCAADTKHVAISGTSMAAPHVAGAMALMRQAYPQDTPAQIKERLKATARNLGATYNDQGAGEINLKAAIPSNQQISVVPSGIWQIETDPTKKISASTQAFSVKPLVDSATLSVAIQNNHSGISVVPDKTTLSVAGKTTDTLNLNVSVDNDIAKTGTYTGISAILSSDGVTRGIIGIIVRVKPTIAIEPVTIDYGIDNPALASWTSPTVQVTIANLRTDIAQNVTAAASNLPGGVTLNGLAGVTELNPGASKTITTSMAVSNNTVVANGYYERILINFASGNSMVAGTTKFYKAYYLDLTFPDSDATSAWGYVWDYEKNTTIAREGMANPSRYYFLTPGKTDVIVRFRPADNFVKEDIDLSSGTAVVAVRKSEITNSVTITGTDEENRAVVFYAKHSGIRKKTTAFKASQRYDSQLNSATDTERFNNVSANFVAWSYYKTPQPNSEKVYFIGRETSGGITSNINITNTPSDLKLISIQANSNRVGGALNPVVPFGAEGLAYTALMGARTISSPVQKIYYANISQTDVFIRQATEHYPDAAGCPATGPCMYNFISPYIFISSGNVSYNKFQGATNYFDKIESGQTSNGLGPVFFNGNFYNSGTNIGLNGALSGYAEPLFLCQDYSIGESMDTPYVIKNSSGTLINSGIIPATDLSGPTIKVVAPTTGKYTFEVPSYTYYVQGKPFGSSVNVSFTLGTNDPNPPKIKNFRFYTDGRRSDAFVPDAANKIEMAIDPLGGTIASQKVTYSTDGTNFTDAVITPGTPLTVANIPGIPSSVAKLTVKIDATDAAGNSLSYKFEVPKSIQATEPPADTTNPDVSLTAPVANSTVSGTTGIIAVASDNIGIAKVEFYVNGVLKGSDMSSPYNYPWDTASVANGNHALSAKAYDAAGNIGVSSPVNVTVNNGISVPTVVTITYPVSGTKVTSGSVINITATVSGTAAISKVEFYINKKVVVVDTAAPYAYAWKVPSGKKTYSIYAKAYDAVGKITNSPTITVTGQ